MVLIVTVSDNSVTLCSVALWPWSMHCIGPQQQQWHLCALDPAFSLLKKNANLLPIHCSQGHSFQVLHLQEPERNRGVGDASLPALAWKGRIVCLPERTIVLGCLVRAWLGQVALLAAHGEGGSALPAHCLASGFPEDDDPMLRQEGWTGGQVRAIADSTPRFLGLPLVGLVPVWSTLGDAPDSAWSLAWPHHGAHHAPLCSLLAWSLWLRPLGTPLQCLCLPFIPLLMRTQMMLPDLPAWGPGTNPRQPCDSISDRIHRDRPVEKGRGIWSDPDSVTYFSVTTQLTCPPCTAGSLLLMGRNRENTRVQTCSVD